MKYLKLFEGFRPYIGKGVKSSRKPIEIGYIKQPVEIRIVVDKSPHADDRQWRHGVDNKITDDDLLDVLERSVEELTIALMHDEFNVYDENGELTRFVIKDKETNLNLVCILEPGEWEFRLQVITNMRKEDFKTNPNQFVLEI